jgi:hypothetical protein
MWFILGSTSGNLGISWQTAFVFAPDNKAHFVSLFFAPSSNAPIPAKLVTFVKSPTVRTEVYMPVKLGQDCYSKTQLWQVPHHGEMPNKVSHT